MTDNITHIGKTYSTSRIETAIGQVHHECALALEAALRSQRCIGHRAIVKAEAQDIGMRLNRALIRAREIVEVIESAE